MHSSDRYCPYFRSGFYLATLIRAFDSKVSSTGQASLYSVVFQNPQTSLLSGFTITVIVPSIWTTLRTVVGPTHQTKHLEIVLCKLGINVRLPRRRPKLASHVTKLNNLPHPSLVADNSSALKRCYSVISALPTILPFSITPTVISYPLHKAGSPQAPLCLPVLILCLLIVFLNMIFILL